MIAKSKHQIHLFHKHIYIVLHNIGSGPISGVQQLEQCYIILLVHLPFHMTCHMQLSMGFSGCGLCWCSKRVTF